MQGWITVLTGYCTYTSEVRRKGREELARYGVQKADLARYKRQEGSGRWHGWVVQGVGGSEGRKVGTWWVSYLFLLLFKFGLGFKLGYCMG